MAKVGIDFGTTNSSVMFCDEGNKKFVSLLTKNPIEIHYYSNNFPVIYHLK